MSFDGKRDTSECWTEDEVDSQFPAYYFNLKAKPTRQQPNNDVDQNPWDRSDILLHLPCRVLDDWYLRVKPNRSLFGPVAYDQKAFPHHRVSLPVNSQDLEGYILVGTLKSQQSGQNSIRVELDNLDFYTIDNTREFWGYWVVTSQAKYWLGKPCSKVLEVPRINIRFGGEYSIDKTSNLSAQLPSQEQLHTFHRTQLQLLSYLMDITILSDGSYNTFIHNLSLAQINELLLPKSIKLSKSSYLLVPHIRVIDPNLEKSRWFRELLSIVKKEPQVGSLQSVASEWELIQSPMTDAFHSPLDSTWKANRLESWYPILPRSEAFDFEDEMDDENDYNLPPTTLSPIVMNKDLLALLSQPRDSRCTANDTQAKNDKTAVDGHPRKTAATLPLNERLDLSLSQSPHASSDRATPSFASVVVNKSSDSVSSESEGELFQRSPDTKVNEDDPVDSTPANSCLPQLSPKRHGNELPLPSKRRYRRPNDTHNDLHNRHPQKKGPTIDIPNPTAPAATTPSSLFSTIPKKRRPPVNDTESSATNTNELQKDLTEPKQSPTTSVSAYRLCRQGVDIARTPNISDKMDTLAEERQPCEPSRSAPVVQVNNSSTIQQGQFKRRKLADPRYLQCDVDQPLRAEDIGSRRSHMTQSNRWVNRPLQHRRPRSSPFRQYSDAHVHDGFLNPPQVETVSGRIHPAQNWQNHGRTRFTQRPCFNRDDRHPGRYCEHHERESKCNPSSEIRRSMPPPGDIQLQRPRNACPEDDDNRTPVPFLDSRRPLRKHHDINALNHRDFIWNTANKGGHKRFEARYPQNRPCNSHGGI